MTTTQCAHHWLIETAAGPLSKGVCRLCGEEREFTNSTDFHGMNWTTQSKRSQAALQPEEPADD